MQPADPPNHPIPPEPDAPPQLGDGFSPPVPERQADAAGGGSLADPAEPPHAAPWAASDF